MKQKNFIFGIHPVIEAIRSGKEIEKLLLQKGARGEGFREVFSLAREFEIPFQFVPQEKLNSFSKQNHQGVLAFLSEITYQKVSEMIPFIYEQGRAPLILVLDRITDVRNFGAIARTAECAGVDALLIPGQGSAQINSEAIKTSAGALYKLPVCRSQSLRDDLILMKESGLSIIAASEKATKPYLLSDLKGPVAIILGSEGTGIAGDLLELADQHVMIPVLGEISSLNVSVAAGVFLFEAVRQRHVHTEDTRNK